MIKTEQLSPLEELNIHKEKKQLLSYMMIGGDLCKKIQARKDISIN